MLLGNKKTQREEQNWCIVLSPLRNEIDKKRVSRKISGVFSLSAEEATDLVSNTPIILLDNLTRSVAVEIKEYFRSAGAEMILTNDVFLKRKCYRTVWPEPPNLSFLNQKSQETSGLQRPPVEAEEVLNPEDALAQIRTLSAEAPRKPEATPIPQSYGMRDSERQDLLEEADRWRRECTARRVEIEKLQHQLEQATKQLSIQQLPSLDQTATLKEREKEIADMRGLLTSSQEKYDALREEYRETRALLEEKVAGANEDKDRESRTTRDLMRKWESSRDMVRDVEVKIAESESARVELMNSLAELQGRIDQAEEKINILERAKESLERALNEQTELASSWRERFEGLNGKFDSLNAEQNEERLRREDELVKIREIELEKDDLSNKLADSQRRYDDVEMKLRESQNTVDHLLREKEEQESLAQEQWSNRQERERELEETRRQLRTINFQAEQREAANKRTYMANRIAEREMQLKKLVREQERIESEIRDREQSMRETLSEQERLEKEIVECKQTQRHLVEQVKKEKLPRLRVTKTENGANMSEQTEGV
ncbi:MAG: hypothetical protein Q8R76_01730 [Candidatus Omnitrophota bacterium]|nr:hypothetical protein [Candidatus Omnitrophota bacterium]